MTGDIPPGAPSGAPGLDAARLAAMRVDYRTESFDVGDLAPTWHEQLRRWLDDANAAGIPDANAMVLATSDSAGRPSSRTVLCKAIDAAGIVFFTNYTSAKSHDLRFGRLASVTFPWYALHRQVHLSGTVDEVDRSETDAYWAQRPRGSQLGAWASPQSAVVADRRALDDSLASITRMFADAEHVPVPPHWGGWRIEPDRVEFWQGRRDRMHDRLRFERAGAHGWAVQRLAP